MTNSGHSMGGALLQRQLATLHSEPALSDWTAAGARTYLIPKRDDDGFDKA